MYIKKFLRFMRPDDEGAAGGMADRGDEWVATDDADDAAKKLGVVTDETKLEPAAKVDEAKVDEAEAKADETKAKIKDARIPAARHAEILNKERERREAVEVELAKYKQGGQIAATNVEITAAEEKLVGLEVAYAKQLTDNEPAKAAATMTEIRRLERAINTQTSQLRETAATARAVETVRYDTTVERLEREFPELNQDHDDFSKEKTAEVLELKEAYQLKGYTPSAALQKAVKYVMPPVTKKQEAAVEVEARVDANEVEKARKAAAVAKTAEAVKNTPASTSKVGLDSDKAGGGSVTAKDAIKMPYKDFVKLDENALAAMRGDVL